MSKTKRKLPPDFFKKIGKKGGKATLDKHGKNHFSKMAKDVWRKRARLQAK